SGWHNAIITTSEVSGKTTLSHCPLFGGKIKYSTGPKEIHSTIHVYFELFDNTYRSMAGLGEAVPEELLLVEVGERLGERGVFGGDLKRNFGKIVWDFLMFEKLQKVERWMVDHS
ncbi:MAG: hypothetical protein PF961_13395, partial [Planctomycetota bacterium]|nr:hypothetical protein [Planctomycetota bacterium]